MSLAVEKRTIRAMIEIYCKRNHGSFSLCTECEDLLSYAQKRIDNCPFGEKKPACNKCTVHCYAKENREKVREVMRFSGPKMPMKHPILSLKHLLKNNS